MAFSATAGGIAPQSSGVTDASGTATALLTTAGDPSNQVITIRARSGAALASIQVPETGTTLNVSGPPVVGSGATANYTVTLTNSSAVGLSNKTVSLASALGNGITPASALTDVNGQAKFVYTGTTGGSDTLTASAAALNASNTTTIAVSPTKLAFSAPAANTTIPFGAVQPVTVQYTQNGAPVPNATISFSATRGTFNGASATSATATTDASGNATVNIQSNGSGGAGGSIVSAQAANNGPSATLAVVFQANAPATIAIQATPSTIAPSATSTVTAVVRDASDNLVAGQLVNFVLTDPTGGSLSSASGTTDQSGSVTVTYQATSTTSAINGVQISASVNGTGVTTAAPAQITVGGKALRITMGTGNTITVLDQTRYQMPYSVLVTDSAGNPPPNGTTFSLSLVSQAYQKGSYTFPTGASEWQQNFTVSSDPDFDSTGFGCKNEDANGNGILDTGEDYNSNGVLDPGNVASVPSTLALDATGSAQFFITYPKDHANWVEVKLTGIATVAGTETTATRIFILPILQSDLSNQNVPPPGHPSPYGVATSCASPN